MTFSKFLILFTAVVLFQTTAALADKYEVFQYPRPDGNCAAAADIVATAFQATAKVTVQNKTGTTAGKGRCDLKFTYANHGAAYLVTTHNTEPLFQAADLWHYTSLAECDATLADQTATFEQETGLKAVVAYCAELSALSAGRKPALIIQSFGMAKKFPYQFKLADVGQAQGPWNQAVVKALIDRGATLFRLAESKVKGRQFRDVIHYFVPASLGVTNVPSETRDLHYANNEDCLSDLNQWKGAGKAMGATTAVAGCFPLAAKKGMQLQVVAFFPAHSQFNMVPVTEQDYDGPFACRQDMERVMALYKQLYALDFKGGFCPLKSLASPGNRHAMVLLAR